jgi:tetratricopeptide (TPR) repeat protein
MLKNSSILLGFLLMSGNVNALTLCNEEFSVMNQDKKYLEIGEKINYWESLSDKCSGSGLYELRLSQLYVEDKQNNKAKNIINDALKLKTDFDKNLLFNMAEIEASIGNLDEALSISQSLINKYKEWAGGYYKVGMISTWKNDSIRAVKAFEKVNELEDNASSYSMLAYNYHNLKQHKEAIIAMQRAIKLDANELGNRVAVPATAYSLIELGYMDEAENLLMKHQAVRPESQHDSDFVKVAVYLQMKLDEAEKEDASISAAE